MRFWVLEFEVWWRTKDRNTTGANLGRSIARRFLCLDSESCNLLWTDPSITWLLQHLTWPTWVQYLRCLAWCGCCIKPPLQPWCVMGIRLLCMLRTHVHAQRKRKEMPGPRTNHCSRFDCAISLRLCTCFKQPRLIGSKSISLGMFPKCQKLNGVDWEMIP